MDWKILQKLPNEPDLAEKQAKGTRILAGALAQAYFNLQVELTAIAQGFGCLPIILPTVEPSSIYSDKAGPEVLGQMYVFKDKGERDLCLRPEATATCQLLAQSTYKTFRDLKFCYWQKCYRYERPQSGRYREFTQFGIEVLNPTRDWTDDLVKLAELMLRRAIRSPFIVSRGVKRGLGIYNAEGFEILVEELGAQKQVVGGGPYENGQGFAIGVDRLLCVPGTVEDWGTQISGIRRKFTADWPWMKGEENNV